MIKIRKIKGKRIISIVIIFLIITFSGISVLEIITERNATWKPDYPQVQLGNIVNKGNLNEEEYHTILMQTGLGKPAVDSLMKEIEKGQDRLDLFQEYQEDFFNSKNYECRKISLIVYEERIRNAKGDLIKGFKIPSIKAGDVLITKATHTLGWRHGHAAMVTNASKGETLEAVVWGSNSKYQNITKWQTYPSFILLRLKEDSEIVAEDIADFALKNVYDIPYGLFTGMPKKAPEGINKTQCSHLVWYPYFQFGYDIDSDGSWLVTPNDIANSDVFEIVQVFGVNPEEIWP